jgi:threonine dehydrogenase-like Zn-dependent dehydrogenase
MKALVYEGPRDVVVKNVPDAKIERPTDVLVKITSTNICGSDLHMYEGRTDMEEGRVLGHENLGQVTAKADAGFDLAGGDGVRIYREPGGANIFEADRHAGSRQGIWI